MTAKYIIKKRSQYSLASIETLLVSVIAAYLLCRHYQWDWIVGLILFFASTGIITALFFRVRIFRFIFSIAFSLFWGFLAYGFSTMVTKSTFTPWLALLFIFAICLVIHRDYFQFKKNAEVIEYRE